MDTLPPEWRWLTTADPNTPIPEEVPFEVTVALGFKSYEGPLRRASAAAAVFWAARGNPPDFNRLPRVIRLTCYQSVRDGSLPSILTAAAARPWLQNLTVMGGEITRLPPEIGGLEQVYRLSFEDNQLTELPADVAKLVRLHTLVLDGNPLLSIDPAIATMGALRELRVRGSRGAPMPMRALPVLPHMRKLSLGWAPALVTRLTEYESLTTLALHGDVGPEGLPAELAELGSLTALALAYSPLATVPEAVRALKRLHTLSLPYGAFEALPDWLPELEALRLLAVFGCDTMTPDHIVDTVARLPALGKLDLPFPFPQSARERLKKLGFRSLTANPSVMYRPGFDAFDDVFSEIR